MKTKLNLVLFACLLVGMVSCDLDGSTHFVSTEYIAMEADSTLDSVAVLHPVPVKLRASVPNTCWRAIRFTKEEYGDTVLVYGAFATFEYVGLPCDTIPSIKDTTFQQVFTKTGRKYLKFYSRNKIVRTDTLVVY